MENTNIAPLDATADIEEQMTALAMRYRVAIKGEIGDLSISSETIPSALKDIESMKNMINAFKDIGAGCFADVDKMWDNYLTYIDTLEAVLISIQERTANYYLSTGTN